MGPEAPHHGRVDVLHERGGKLGQDGGRGEREHDPGHLPPCGGSARAQGFCVEGGSAHGVLRRVVGA